MKRELHAVEYREKGQWLLHEPYFTESKARHKAEWLRVIKGLPEKHPDVRVITYVPRER